MSEIGKMLVEQNRDRRDLKNAMRAERIRRLHGSNNSKRSADADRKTLKNKVIYSAEQMGSADKL